MSDVRDTIPFADDKEIVSDVRDTIPFAKHKEIVSDVREQSTIFSRI